MPAGREPPAFDLAVAARIRIERVLRESFATMNTALQNCRDVSTNESWAMDRLRQRVDALDDYFGGGDPAPDPTEHPTPAASRGGKRHSDET